MINTSDFEFRTEASIIPSLTKVESKLERDAYWSTLLQLWQLPSSQRHFPGSHPVPIVEETLSDVKNESYVASLKTDGIRFLLLLTMRYENDDVSEPIALMIDRNLDMYEISVWGNHTFFTKGTLLDGELAWNTCNNSPDGTLTYAVFDVVAISGKHVADRSFSERLQLIHDTLFVQWKNMSASDLETHVRDEQRIVCKHTSPHVISFIPKACCPVAQVQSLWESRSQSRLRVDGILFMECAAPMVVGRTDAILKWKPHHTIDVKLDQKAQQEAHAYIDTFNGIRRSKWKCKLLSASLKKHVHVVTKDNKLFEETSTGDAGMKVYECAIIDFNEEKLVLFPIRERIDKSESNSLNTIMTTLTMKYVSVSRLVEACQETKFTEKKKYE